MEIVGCEFCEGKGKLRRNYGIGTPMIEYYCPVCNVQDERKVPWIVCPACDGAGYFKRFGIKTYGGVLDYYKKIGIETCYMCNGRKEIQLTKWGQKKISKYKAVKGQNNKFRDFLVYLLVIVVVAAVGMFLLMQNFQETGTNGISKGSTPNVGNTTADGNPYTTGSANIVSSKADMSDVEREIFRKLNRIREQNNAPPLKWSDKISFVAKERAKELAEQEYFAHTSPSGKDFKDFLNEYGIFYIMAAENLYYAEGMDVESLADAAVDGWMKSPGHRSPILDYDKSYDEVGVGVYCKKACYISAIFIDNSVSDEIELRPGYLTFISLYDEAFPFSSLVAANVTLKSDSGVNVYFVPSIKEYKNLVDNKFYSYYQRWENTRHLRETLLLNKGSGLVIENAGDISTKISYTITYGEKLGYINQTNALYNQGCIDLYDNTVELRNREFTYIPVGEMDNIIIKTIIDASKPINMYVVDGSWEQINRLYIKGFLPSDFIICKSSFVKYVNESCYISDKYPFGGVLIDNKGVGRNVISVKIQLCPMVSEREVTYDNGQIEILVITPK